MYKRKGKSLSELSEKTETTSMKREMGERRTEVTFLQELEVHLKLIII